LNPDAVGNAPVILYPKDGWCDAVVYAGSVVGGAVERYGLTLVEAKVTGLRIAGGRCDGVILADGTVHEADIVVNCSGRWSNDVASEKDYQVPLAPTVGLIAYTQAAGVRLKRALRTPLVNMAAAASCCAPTSSTSSSRRMRHRLRITHRRRNC
jgi:glycine/D-amino acid oxidase-like deaminating enzyme